MKYAVMANLRFETPAKRDSLDNAVKDNIGRKWTWGENVIQSGIDEQGYPSQTLLIRFYVKSNMDELFALIKEKIGKIPVLKGTVSKHNCSHDESPPQPCIIIEEISK